MRNVVTFAFLCFFSHSASAEPVVFTAFNIEWYGSHTKVSTAAQDSRNQSIRDFLQVAGVNADVYAFEEILDVEELSTSLLENRYSCHSYNESNLGHQHVVICHKKSFDFRIANDDDNYSWENIAMGRLRPAVHGILLNKAGRELAHVIAVHLKAMPDQSAIRLEQTRMLASNIRNRGDNLPVIMLGDFNSYDDDIERMTEVLQETGTSFAPVEAPFLYTYRTSRYRNKFDWLFLSAGTQVKGPATVAGPCNSNWNSGTQFDDLAYFNDRVSDHCPVTVEINL